MNKSLRKAAFLKDLLIKVVVADTKIKFFKNQRPESEIGLLEASRIGLKLSDPKGIDHNLKIQRAFGFGSDPINRLFHQLFIAYDNTACVSTSVFGVFYHNFR